MLIIAGVLAFVSPVTWVIFVGVYMLFDGMILLAGFNDHPGQSRWPLLIIGILGLLAGLIILWNRCWRHHADLRHRRLGRVTGILTIITALRLREEIDNEWWLVLSGVLAIVFGILVFQNVLAGILTIAWVFGIFAVVVGILSIALAFRVRDFRGPSQGARGAPHTELGERPVTSDDDRTALAVPSISAGPCVIWFPAPGHWRSCST